MSAEFESGMFVGDPAWHGLGNVLDSAPKTSMEAMHLAGLDWIVQKQRMFLANGDEIPDAYAMVRNIDNAVLGTVGNRYTPLQNSEAFDFFDPLIEDGLAQYETAGSLMGGKRVWVLAKLTGDIEVGKNDVINKYVLLSNSHDGTSNVTGKTTPIRVVCQNTLSAALRLKGSVKDEVKIRHTKSVTDKVKEAAKLLETVNKAYDSLYKVWQKMVEVKMPPEDVSAYFQTVFPDPENVDRPYKTQKIRTEVHLLQADSSLGGTLDSAMGTLWGAYNAVTAYADHVRSKRKDSTDEKHLENVWFGQRAKVKDAAMDAALEYMNKQGVHIDL